MLGIHSLILLDIAASILMIVLASLSRRLGDALKIPRYYRFIYMSIALVLAAAGMNAVSLEVGAGALRQSAFITLAHIMRICAGLIAVGVCLRYWKWLFGEFIKK